MGRFTFRSHSLRKVHPASQIALNVHESPLHVPRILLAICRLTYLVFKERSFFHSYFVYFNIAHLLIFVK